MILFNPSSVTGEPATENIFIVQAVGPIDFILVAGSRLTERPIGSRLVEQPVGSRLADR